MNQLAGLTGRALRAVTRVFKVDKGIEQQKTPADHEVPRCETCDNECYNLACRKCGLRICDRCWDNGDGCMCPEEIDKENTTVKSPEKIYKVIKERQKHETS